MHHQQYRKAALALYEHLKSMRKVAAILEVSPASICRWQKRLPKRTREVCSYSTKVTAAMLETAKALLDQDPCISQADLSMKLSGVVGAAVSKYLVRTILHKIGYSYKRTRSRGLNYRQGTLRQEFLAAMHDLPHDALVVALDESGFDHRMKPLYGYSRKGQPAIVKYKTCKDRRRYSLLMAIDSRGGQAHHINPGSTKGSHISTFIAGLPYPEGTTIILDNAAIHKTAEVRDVASSKGYIMQFIAPYCCEDNPIEMVFSAVKRHYYKGRCSSSWGDDVLKQVHDAVVARAVSGTIIGCFKYVRRQWQVPHE